MPARSWPAGTASPEDCRFRHSSSFHHISSAFSLIVFSLKSLQPPQKSGWPLPVSQGQCTVGLLPLWVPCAVSEHHAALYQGLGVDQFVVGCIADNMDKCSFCADGRCLDDVRSPRRGSPPLASRRGNFLLPPRERRWFVWGRAWGSLRVGGGAPSSYFRFLCQGFLLPLLLSRLPQLF